MCTIVDVNGRVSGVCNVGLCLPVRCFEEKTVMNVFRTCMYKSDRKVETENVLQVFFWVCGVWKKLIWIQQVILDTLGHIRSVPKTYIVRPSYYILESAPLPTQVREAQDWGSDAEWPILTSAMIKWPQVSGLNGCVPIFGFVLPISWKDKNQIIVCSWRLSKFHDSHFVVGSLYHVTKQNLSVMLFFCTILIFPVWGIKGFSASLALKQFHHSGQCLAVNCTIICGKCAERKNKEKKRAKITAGALQGAPCIQATEVQPWSPILNIFPKMHECSMPWCPIYAGGLTQDISDLQQMMLLWMMVLGRGIQPGLGWTDHFYTVGLCWMGELPLHSILDLVL